MVASNFQCFVFECLDVNENVDLISFGSEIDAIFKQKGNQRLLVVNSKVMILA